MPLVPRFRLTLAICMQGKYLNQTLFPLTAVLLISILRQEKEIATQTAFKSVHQRDK